MRFTREFHLLLFLLVASECQSAIQEKSFTMPITNIEQDDAYMCSSFKLDDIEERYFDSLSFTVDELRAHHVAAGVCEEPISTEKTWDCSHTVGKNCRGAAVHLAGWDDYTKEKENLVLPKGLTVRLGSKSKLKYFVIAVHYRKAVAEQDQKTPVASAAVRLSDKSSPLYYQSYLLTNTGFIPEGNPHGYFSSSACEWTNPNAFAFEYFVHTHHHGVFVEGFLVRNKTWTLLGSMLSQSKTKGSAEVIGGPIEIKPGDILAGRCLYLNPSDKPVYFGTKDDEEMCTFHISVGFYPEYEEHFSKPMACISKSPQFSLCKFPEKLGRC